MSLNSTPAERRPKAQRAPAIPYPDLPPTTGCDALFWRAAWLRDEAQLAALNAFVSKAWPKLKAPELRDAISLSECRARHERGASFERLIKHGGLLYAWIPEGGAA